MRRTFQGLTALRNPINQSLPATGVVRQSYDNLRPYSTNILVTDTGNVLYIAADNFTKNSVRGRIIIAAPNGTILSQSLITFGEYYHNGKTHIVTPALTLSPSGHTLFVAYYSDNPTTSNTVIVDLFALQSDPVQLVLNTSYSYVISSEQYSVQGISLCALSDEIFVISPSINSASGPGFNTTQFILQRIGQVGISFPSGSPYVFASYYAAYTNSSSSVTSFFFVASTVNHDQNLIVRYDYDQNSLMSNSSSSLRYVYSQVLAANQPGVLVISSTADLFYCVQSDNLINITKFAFNNASVLSSFTASVPNPAINAGYSLALDDTHHSLLYAVGQNFYSFSTTSLSLTSHIPLPAPDSSSGFMDNRISALVVDQLGTSFVSVLNGMYVVQGEKARYESLPGGDYMTEIVLGDGTLWSVRHRGGQGVILTAYRGGVETESSSESGEGTWWTSNWNLFVFVGVVVVVAFLVAPPAYLVWKNRNQPRTGYAPVNSVE